MVFSFGKLWQIFCNRVGTALGFVSNFYQEHLYQSVNKPWHIRQVSWLSVSKHFDRRGPEARLILACAAAVMLPISMFIYAWCSFPSVPWISLAIAVTVSFLFAWERKPVYRSNIRSISGLHLPFISPFSAISQIGAYWIVSLTCYWLGLFLTTSQLRFVCVVRVSWTKSLQ